MKKKYSRIAKHIIIDSEDRTVEWGEDGIDITLKYMQSVVGGLITSAPSDIIKYPDYMFVDDDGWLQSPAFGFKLGDSEYCIGDAIIVGDEIEYKGGVGYKDVVTDIEEVRKNIKWLWFK